MTEIQTSTAAILLNGQEVITELVYCFLRQSESINTSMCLLNLKKVLGKAFNPQKKENKGE